MIFHLTYELPEPRETRLDETLPDLTSREVDILKDQILKNAEKIADYVERLDLLLNKEKHLRDEGFIQKIRRHLYLLMDENDTFRKVLWRHMRKRSVPKFD